jgi:hypothetical protein
MNKFIEIRNQEMMCRERAVLESERREFWLAKAEEWGQRALDEIAFQLKPWRPRRLSSITSSWRLLISGSSALHDFFPQDFMHILYSDLHVGPA